MLRLRAGAPAIEQAADDLLHAGFGNDSIVAGDALDSLDGGDNVDAGSGNNTILGGFGIDNLIAGLGCGPHAGQPPTPINPMVLSPRAD